MALMRRNVINRISLFTLICFLSLISTPFADRANAQESSSEGTQLTRISEPVDGSATLPAQKSSGSSSSGRITGNPVEANSTVEISLGDTGNPVGQKVKVTDPTGKWAKKLPAAKKAYTWSKVTTVSTAQATSAVFKDNFTAQSIALNAGSAFASKLYDQYKKGENLDFVKAAKFIVSGESIGSFTGAALGATAGTAVGTLIATGIPVVGPVVGALIPAFGALTGSTMGTQMGRDFDSNQKVSFKKAWAAIDKPDLIGRTIGATAGMALGNLLLPGIGGFIGSIAGNIIGSKVVSLIRYLNGKIKQDEGSTAATGEDATQETQNDVNPYSSSKNSSGETSFINATSANILSEDSLYVAGSGLKKLQDAKSAYYKTYTSLLNQGKGDSAEANEALANYTKASQEYSRLSSQNSSEAIGADSKK